MGEERRDQGGGHLARQLSVSDSDSGSDGVNLSEFRISIGSMFVNLKLQLGFIPCISIYSVIFIFKNTTSGLQFKWCKLNKTFIVTG